MAHIILFQHRSYRGHHRHLFDSERNLNHPEDKSLNDKISSFVVLEGKWQFYRDKEFGGGQLGGVYGPGNHPWVGDDAIMNDAISSVKLVG